MNLLEVSGLGKRFAGTRDVLALDAVSLRIEAGKTLGLVGPSGCGKSTLARVLCRLIAADTGRVRFDGLDWLALSGAALRRARGRMQMVFQDPAAAFHPRATVTSALGEALRLHDARPAAARPARIAELLAQVELDPALAARPLAALSGGQRQRVAIARAIAPAPKLVVLDEATSALDASVRARVLELLVRLQRELGLAYLFVSHDLAVVRAISHRIAVMEAGRIIETGPAEAALAAPGSALLRRLIAAVPQLPATDEAAPASSAAEGASKSPTDAQAVATPPPDGAAPDPRYSASDRPGFAPESPHGTGKTPGTLRCPAGPGASAPAVPTLPPSADGPATGTVPLSDTARGATGFSAPGTAAQTSSSTSARTSTAAPLGTHESGAPAPPLSASEPAPDAPPPPTTATPEDPPA